MTSLLDQLALFHFIRPGWLFLVPFVLLLWWWVRRITFAERGTAIGIAEHLAAFSRFPKPKPICPIPSRS